MAKPTYHIEYEGDIKNDFYQYIDPPQLFSTKECFCGELKDDKFWFYKKYPMQRNSFRTVLYGEIMNDHQICYRYGKMKGALIVLLLFDVVAIFIFIMSLLISFLVVGPSLPPIQMVFMFMMVVLVNVFMFIYPKREKDILYDQLKKMCKINTYT